MNLLTQVSGFFVGAFGDNPVLTKDAALLLRRKVAAATWIVVAVGLFAVAGLVFADNSRDSLRVWGALNPAGGDMLLVLLGFVLAATSILVPALAATSITSEREQGTLPLLIVSGLTPARIVAGKFGAIMTAALPFLAISLPLFALASVFLGVDVDAVALAVVAVFVHAAAVTATGVWASAHCDRMRSAVMSSMIASALPTLLGAAPIFASLVACVEDQQHQLLLVGVVGVAIEAVITAAALVGAWSVLAPGSADRWTSGRRVLLAAVPGVPAVITLVLLIAGAATMTKNDTGAFLFLMALGAIGVTQAMAPALTGRRQGTPNPSTLSFAVFVVGGIAAFVTYLALPSNMRLHGPDADDVVALYAIWFGGAGVVALLARHIKHPVAVVVGIAAFYAVLFATPGVLDEFTYGRPPLAFLNPAYVLDRDDVATFATVIFYGAVGLATFVASRGPRRA